MRRVQAFASLANYLNWFKKKKRVSPMSVLSVSFLLQNNSLYNFVQDVTT